MRRTPYRLSARAAGVALAAALVAPAPPAVPPVHAQPRLLTVPGVDLDRYLGTWHEVARLPNRFQQHCESDVTATYTRRDDGTLAVVNRCRTANGAWDVAEGIAWPQDETNARLTVTFLPAWLRWLPFGRGDYWVLELDPDYRWALVGEPGRRYLWVLSRQPEMPKDVLDGVLGRAREMGFPVGTIEFAARQAPTR